MRKLLRVQLGGYGNLKWYSASHKQSNKVDYKV